MVAAKRYIKCPGDTVLRDFYSTDNEEMHNVSAYKTIWRADGPKSIRIPDFVSGQLSRRHMDLCLEQQRCKLLINSGCFAGFAL